jgi:exonuclease III
MSRDPTNPTGVADRQSQTTQAPPNCNDTETNNPENVPPYYGDHPGPVKPDHFRIANINLNNISPYNDSSCDESLFYATNAHDIDVLCMQEIGCNWTNIPQKDSFQKRLDTYYQPRNAKSRVSSNIHDLTGTRKQWGGTGILCKNKIRHYTTGTGNDPKGLGRWTWARYRGKGGMNLRIISVYCPCVNKTGPLSVYRQQTTYLQEHNDDRNPRKALLEDLQREIEIWQEEGDQILICGDLNHEVMEPTITNLFTKLSMKNLLYEKHSYTDAPSTYFKDKQGRIMDGMWGTEGLYATRCGYLEPKDFPGDHSLLWLDISYESALGHNPPTPTNPDARRLQLNKPKVVKRYLDLYEEQVNQLKIPQRQFRLESTAPYGQNLNTTQRQEAEALDYLRSKCIGRADRKCQKI